MATLALCMIVKNEEDTLINLFNSTKGVFDEIIVVDTGSEDGTVALAEKYADKVCYFDWIDDFAAARNFSFSQAKSDYIMWLDADDVLLDEDREKLIALKKRLDGKIREIAALYNTMFDEEGNVAFNYYRERIFLRSANFKWSGRIHEVIPLEIDCYYADFAVTHRKVHPTERGRNLRIFEKMKEDGEFFDGRSTFYYARELYYNGRLEEAEREFEIFLRRDDGLAENKIDACAMLAEISDKRKRNPLPYLFKSFEYGVPQAEICCEIGEHFKASGKYAEAIYWYEEALKMQPPKNAAFIKKDCYGFIPCMELCVLYYAIGDTQKSILMNEMAAKIKPNSLSVRHNFDFFEKISQKY